jgi:hypothetical protein
MNLTKSRVVWIVVGFAVGLLLFWWTREAPPPPAPVAADAPKAERDPVVATPVAPPDPYREVPEAVSDDERAERNEARHEAGTGENQLEHLLKSVVQANAEELKLTPEEVDRLASAYLEYQEVHAELVSRYLQETNFDPSSVSVRLPAHPVEGKMLRDMFYRRLETDFPGGKAAEIQSQIGGFFDNAFRGFGVTEQTFTIKRSPEVADAFEVSWEANVPEGVTAASINPDVNFPGSSGTTLLYREQVATGEYRFLGDIVERRFPSPAASSSR